jgi:hypothetical protein
MPVEWIQFVETIVFTRLVRQHELESALRDLQLELVDNPTAGDLDPGTGGLRKVRMPDPGRSKGKRGGVRVHFLWLPHRKRIYLLYLYQKSESDALTSSQKSLLRQVVRLIKETS